MENNESGDSQRGRTAIDLQGLCEAKRQKFIAKNRIHAGQLVVMNDDGTVSSLLEKSRRNNDDTQA